MECVALCSWEPLFALWEWSAMKSLMKVLTRGAQTPVPAQRCEPLTGHLACCWQTGPTSVRSLEPIVPLAGVLILSGWVLTLCPRLWDTVQPLSERPQDLSPPVEQDVAQICQQQDHYPLITFSGGAESKPMERFFFTGLLEMYCPESKNLSKSESNSAWIW